MSGDACKILFFKYLVLNKITVEKRFNIAQNIHVRAGEKRFSAIFFLKHYTTNLFTQMQ